MLFVGAICVKILLSFYGNMFFVKLFQSLAYIVGKRAVRFIMRNLSPAVTVIDWLEMITSTITLPYYIERFTSSFMMLAMTYSLPTITKYPMRLFFFPNAFERFVAARFTQFPFGPRNCDLFFTAPTRPLPTCVFLAIIFPPTKIEYIRSIAGQIFAKRSLAVMPDCSTNAPKRSLISLSNFTEQFTISLMVYFAPLILLRFTLVYWYTIGWLLIYDRQSHTKNPQEIILGV